MTPLDERMSVSVLIPTYNRVKYLADLFETILAQTVKPTEVIVVDDHTPTDEVKCLCRQVAYTFKTSAVELIYIRNPRERSSATARNVGFERARGEILVFLDNDMILDPDYIDEVLKVFKRYDHAVGVQGWHAVRYRGELFNVLLGRVFKRLYYSVNSCRYGEYPRILTGIVPCVCLSGSNMAVKRRVFEEGIRFDENLKSYAYMEDQLFSYSVFKRYRGGLYITPYARCEHRGSREGREQDRRHLNVCHRYVLVQLFGWRGLLLYYRQRLGGFIVELFG